MKLSNKTYDAAKWVAQIGLPALATLYFAVAQIWSLPYGSEVVGSITAFDAFLGVLLGLSSSAYNARGTDYDGVLHIQPPEDGSDVRNCRLQFGDIEDLETKNTITFRVNNLNLP